MLTSIREKTQGIIAAFIVTIVVIPFALWGINSYFEGGSTSLVAKGGGVEISQRVFRNVLDRYRGRVTPDQWENPVFRIQLLESMIAENLVVRDIDDQGYRIGDKELARYIRSLPNFKRNNAFDPELYKTTLRAQRVSVREFEQQARSDLVLDQVQSAYRDSVIVTRDEENRLLALVTQKRSAKYTLIEPERFLSRIKLDENKIREYYEANKARFMTEEKVRIEYLILSAEDLAKDYRPTEEELRALYEEDPDKRFVKPEKRRVSHILIEVGSDGEEQKALEKARSIIKQLKAGKSFAALAKKYSADPGSAGKGGDLGFIAPGLMEPVFETAARKLKKGQISEPVRSRYGYHIIKLTDYKPEVRVPYRKVRPELVKLLQQQKGEQRFFDLSEQFYNTVYEYPDSLKPAAEALDLKPRKSGWFGRSGGEGIAAQQKVVLAAFSTDVLELGRNSEALEIDDTTLVSLRVIGHKKPEQKPLAQVRGEIEDILKREEAGVRARALRDAVLAAVEKEQNFDKVIRTKGLRLKKTGLVTRAGGKDVNPRLLQAVFKAPRPAGGTPVFGSVELGPQGYAVYALTRVQEGDPAKAGPELKERIRELLSQHRGPEYYQNYRTALRKQAEVRIFSENF